MSPIDPIRRLSCDIAKKLFGRVMPQALDQFPDVERTAFPETLEDIKLGEDFASLILRAIDESIRTNREAINKAPTLESILEIVLASVSISLAELKKKVQQEQVVRGLEATLAEHPSLLDRIASAVIPPFETDEEQLLKMEIDLRQCVLKVLNRTTGWMGTAFSVGEGKLFLTAAHMISKWDDQLVLAFDGPVKKVEGRASLVALKRQSDIAVLKLEDEAMLGEFKNAGLKPYSLLRIRKTEDLRGHPVLCLGYHAEEIRQGVRILSPCPAVARVAPHYPIREVEFKGEGTQRCLILVISEGGETVRRGMSGGPILDLKTKEIIAMITGAQQEGHLHHPLGNPEELPIAEYAFGVFLSDVAESWPEFRRCCLQDPKP